MRDKYMAGKTASLQTYPDQYLEYCWKLLIENHPHDSICGSSVSPVHKEVDQRFRKVEQIADQLAMEALVTLSYISNNQNNNYNPQSGFLKIFVYNSLTFTRNELVFVQLNIPSTTSGSSPQYDFKLVEEATGEVVEHIILSEEYSAFWYTLYDVEFREGGNGYNRLNIVFRAKTPSLGFSTYLFHYSNPKDFDNAKAKDKTAQKKSKTSAKLKNKYLSINIGVASGTFNMTQLKTKRVFKKMNKLIYDRDVGNVYHYTPGGDTQEFIGESVTSEIKNNLFQLCTIKGKIKEQKVHLVYFLDMNKEMLEMRVVLNNKQNDWRMQATFPIPNSLVYNRLIVDSHFDVLKREESYDSNPQNYFVDVFDKKTKNGLLFSNLGLPEYTSFRKDSQKYYAITLLRATGQMGDWGNFFFFYFFLKFYFLNIFFFFFRNIPCANCRRTWCTRAPILSNTTRLRDLLIRMQSIQIVVRIQQQASSSAIAL